MFLQQIQRQADFSVAEARKKCSLLPTTVRNQFRLLSALQHLRQIRKDLHRSVPFRRQIRALNIKVIFDRLLVRPSLRFGRRLLQKLPHLSQIQGFTLWSLCKVLLLEGPELHFTVKYRNTLSRCATMIFVIESIVLHI